MLSRDHEDIVDAFRDALVGDYPNCLRRRYPLLNGPRGFYAAIDASVANPMLGFDPGIRADAYVFPGDGAGPIVVEVGSMAKRKWDAVVWAADDRPIRVLRISFELSVGWVNKRRTQFEADMADTVEGRLQELLGEGGIGRDFPRTVFIPSAVFAEEFAQ